MSTEHIEAHANHQGEAGGIQTKVLQKTAAGRPFEVATITRRALRENDVLIDVKAAGICHSDIHTIESEWGPAHYPLTVGHEIAGVVQAVGSQVSKWQVGDRVGVGCLVNSCGECEQCLAGFENHCLKGAVGTYNSVDTDGSITQGGYTQKIVVDENFVCRIPDELDFDHAAPLLCAGITLYSPIAAWDIKEGDQVAVVGLGGLGHMGVQIAAAKGAEVEVLSRTLKKAELAKELGAVATHVTTDPDFFRHNRGRYDYIISTISADFDVDAYLKLLKPRGVMIVVGLPPKAQSLKFGSLIMGSKVLTGSNIGGIAETQEMLDFCGEHGIGAYIEKIGVKDVDRAYERVVASDVQFRFVIDTSTFDEL
ncbi:NAD(P)-dependent alcohol dehydrogenase [Corynebacterium sp. 153RC1]|uniref:NAD(P)-dependent alcohol dehydrogenase n=1 Tax=unclassified Corynebacterium TaxID=2624378 RepID=UPI00211CBF7E|nr:MULTISPECIES: NAD(P)-dependent alcohol dehydrogenase [unclassified Corynebacterium]MCQ9352066.1 NAD(P)-dependent alcohol dehydrogenase [Corynebacterium sp. 209RC1]MCQ9353815.1 NAD(P)-dependent alcohol dehydrogenase [Corynebacterium sp. 1222RC1]MCQ9356201.1 NAD(P)-dependent alcohol dehydrogenase [Corynebacterium sp. 122RC1]MCQ9358303.1 NAD(P)-dependent alcohol dehydrogenase [Corynebacterium sp. 142RC1]MCQ9360962.1 NAD(P)-dependent alcohol dehydrogenase [Corynebacterium sp. 153RC1]